MAITLEREGSIGIIRLNTPPANAYNEASLNELAAAISEVGKDDAIRCAVVASGIEKFFCAGADISTLDGQTTEGLAAFLALAHEILDQMERTPKIFIAAIAGHCIGGGLELALGCDLRIAGDGGYRLGLGEVNLGLSPGMGGTQRLARQIAPGRALHMMISGEMVSPGEALELGIVEWLHPADKHWDEVMTYAGKLADGPSMAQGYIKLSMKGGLAGNLAEGLVLERENQVILSQSEDAGEGIKAFLEKRKPAFKGR